MTRFPYKLSRRTCSTYFSFSFHFSVAKEVTNLIASGHAPPEHLLDSAHLPQQSQPSPQGTQPGSANKLVLETSVGDSRLWYEILRNLSKDLAKGSSILLPESVLSAIDAHHTRMFQREASSEDGKTKMAAAGAGASLGETERRSTGEFVAFSCGHAFPLERFHGKIILEFSNRVSDLPIPVPQTLRYLQLHYQQSSNYPSGCPFCVFNYLRKLQLQIKPDVPIKPWNP